MTTTVDHWSDLRACHDTDPDVFFPDLGSTHHADKVRPICLPCPVRAECLQSAFDAPGLVGEQGWWAGFGPKDRRHARLMGWTATEAITELDRLYDANANPSRGGRRENRSTR